VGSDVLTEVTPRSSCAAINARLPDDAAFTSSHVMTDDAGQYYNAWTAVFGPAATLLCVWHVDRAWHRAIKAHIPDPDEQVEVYHMLRCLLQEVNEHDFVHCLQSFVQHMESMAATFATHFQSYCQRTNEWAYCYCKGTQINTNMY